MPVNTTIYSGWGWDEAFATAVLATALIRKGYRVYVEFPSPFERKGLVITKAYSIGLTQKDGVILNNSTAIQYVPEKKLGVVLRYDALGNSDVVMSFSNVNSITESTIEYVQTLNEDVKVPEQLIKDIERMGNGNIEKLTKIGKVMLKSLKMNYTSKEFRQIMYSFALKVVTTNNLKLTDELLKEAEKYDRAVELAEEIINRREYIPYGKLKVLVISSKFSRDFIRENYQLLKPVAYDLLSKICKNEGVAVLVQETDLGHLIRVCLRDTNVSFVKVISSIPRELSDKLLITLRGNHVIIKFRNLEESTIDNALQLTDLISTAISSALEKGSKQ